jgi:DNA repair protein radc
MHYHGHRERLRERLMDSPQKLKEYEILELLLGYVIKRSDTKPMAKALLDRFGTLRGVVQARPKEYMDIPGLGKGAAAFFTLLQEFLARYAESPVRSRELLCDIQSVAAMARERLGGLAHEEMWVAFVNNSNYLVSWEKCSHGGIDFVAIDNRALMERGLELKATGFILVHNHPGGSPAPSRNDRDLTEQLERLSKGFFLRFIDHVIVSSDSCFSLKSNELF